MARNEAFPVFLFFFLRFFIWYSYLCHFVLIFVVYPIWIFFGSDFQVLVFWTLFEVSDVSGGIRGGRAIYKRGWLACVNRSYLDKAHSIQLNGLMYKAHLLIMRLTDDCILGKRIYSRNKPFIIMKWKIYVPRRQPFLLPMLHFY